MTTSLGGNTQLGRIMVKNGEGATMKKGTIVSFSSVAANNPAVSFLNTVGEPDDYTPNGGTNAAEPQIPYITVKDSVADGATPGTTAALGVVAGDILDGEFGELISYGLAEVLFDGVVAAGITVSHNVDGEAIDAAAASHDNPIGISLEVSVANTTAWCFVNFIGGATGCGAAGFMGQAY